MQSFEEVLAKIKDFYKEYLTKSEMLSYEEVFLDKKLYLNIEKQKNNLQPLAEKYEEYTTTQKALNDIKNLTELDNSEKLLFEEEKENLINKTKKIEQELKKLLIDINSKNQTIIVEINKSKDDLSDKLCKDLCLSYFAFCKDNNLSFENVLGEDNKIQISGQNAKEYFEKEIGKHLAINEDKKGFCNVYVYDLTSLIQIVFNEDDVKITTCRSSGAGGQHINTTDSSIKVTHLPTNLTAVSQDERSQFQNKQKALERLKQKVLNFANKQKEDLILKQKKEQQKITLNNDFVREYSYQKQQVKKQNQILNLTEFLAGKIL